MTAHTAAGKLQGLSEDDYWYEAAFVVGVTNALNVIAEALVVPGVGPLIAPMSPDGPSPALAPVFAQIRAFYEVPEPALVFRILAQDPVYLVDFWGAVSHAFSDKSLSRRLKESIAFAVSLTTRSSWGTPFHLAQMRRLGVTDRGVMEIVQMTQIFSSYTKIADTLQLEPDMANLAPIDRSAAPGGKT